MCIKCNHSLLYIICNNWYSLCVVKVKLFADTVSDPFHLLMSTENSLTTFNSSIIISTKTSEFDQKSPYSQIPY